MKPMPQPLACSTAAVTAGTVNDAIEALAREEREEQTAGGASPPHASLAFGRGIPVPTSRIRRWSGPRVFP